MHDTADSAEADNEIEFRVLDEASSQLTVDIRKIPVKKLLYPCQVCW